MGFIEAGFVSLFLVTSSVDAGLAAHNKRRLKCLLRKEVLRFTRLSQK